VAAYVRQRLLHHAVDGGLHLRGQPDLAHRVLDVQPRLGALSGERADQTVQLGQQLARARGAVVLLAQDPYQAAHGVQGFAAGS
jgi:hypothetical protein